MSLYSPILLAVLALTLFFYWGFLRNASLKRWLLSVVSLGLLGLLHPVFPLTMILLIAVVFACAQQITKGKGAKGAWVLAGIGMLLLCLGVGKYGFLALAALGPAMGWTERVILMPLGLSYFVFKSIQLLLECYRGTLKQVTFEEMLTFLSFFPTLPAGPLETYRGFYDKQSVNFDGELFNQGIRRAVWGFFKKLVILELLFSEMFDGKIAFIAEHGAHGLKAVAFSALMLIRAYVDLSAYTDIAIGLSALFGFRIIENFKSPFSARNISDYWQRWHISLSQWCRNNIYFPLFGMTRKPWIAAQGSMIVMGLWHGATLNWLLWGLFHGTGLSLWAIWGRAVRKFPRLNKSLAHPCFVPVRIGLTLLFVTLGFSLVVYEDFAKSSQLFLSCLRAVATLS